MPDEVVIAAALVLTVFFGKAFYNFQMKRKTKKQRFIEKAKAEGSFVNGECEDYNVQLGLKDSGSDYFRYDTLKVKYRYFVDGVQYYKYMSFQSPGKNVPDFPSTVEVYYYPSNPKKAVCPQEATKEKQRRSGCLICIAATFMFLFISFRLLRFLAGFFF